MGHLGCGKTGHIVLPASKIIGESGVVYAVDILKDKLHDLEKRAHDMGISNIHGVWSNIEKIGSTAIPSASLDVIFLVNVLVKVEDQIAVLEEANRLLKEKCRLIVVDWWKKGASFGPPESQYINFDSIEDWARQRGFTIQEEFTCGPYHAGMVLYRA